MRANVLALLLQINHIPFCLKNCKEKSKKGGKKERKINKSSKIQL